MEYRVLGKTGLKISRVGLGGIPIQRIDAEGTKQLVHQLMDAGVNYIDTARGYTVSEEYLGYALEGIREHFVIATKSMARTREAMAADIDADGDIEYNADEEKHVEGVLDNLITLINHFAKEEYSMEASHQIQRFYVTYYDRFLETKYEDLVANIAECFPKEGADPETLPETMLEVFGFSRGDEFAFVFSPIEVAPIKVEFYNVRPSDIVLTEAEESLCIYENWRNPEDDGYERNLEGWLHNVIHVVTEKGYNDETVTLAQILFAGSLADAEYCSDWDDALIRCFAIEDMNYDNFKLAVEREFGVCTDYNVPLMDYFAAVGSEVGA